MNVVNNTILIVEDEVITALDLKFKLEDLGYEVIDTVATGQEAIDVAAEHCPDLTIMDIKLKGDMNGIEAAEKIIALDLPVIYLTANTDDYTFLKSVKSTAAYAFVEKPFNINALKNAIESAISRSKVEVEKRNLAHGFSE